MMGTLIQFILLASLIISFLLIIGFEYKIKSVSLVLWAGLFVFFLIPHAVDILLGSEEYGISTHNKASIFAICFNIVYLLARLFYFKSISPTYINNMKSLPDDRVAQRTFTTGIMQHTADLFLKILFGILIISFCFLFYFIEETLGNFFDLTWIDIFESSGGVAYKIYSYLFTMSLPFLYLAFIYKRKYMFVAAFVMIMVILFLFRVRTYLIPITIPFLLSFVYRNQFRINFNNIASVLCGTVLIIYLIFAIGVFRVYGTLESLISGASFSDFNRLLYDLLFSKYGEFGLRNAFYFFVDNNNDFTKFGIGLGYLRLLMLPIPSPLSFGLKPQDFAMDMAYAYDPINSVAGVNTMHPTLYGDCYANLGWIGIFLGIFWALFAIVTDTLSKKNNKNIVNLSLYVASTYAFTLIARGAVYNGVYFVYFIFITHYSLWYLCQYILKSGIVGYSSHGLSDLYPKWRKIFST